MFLAPQKGSVYWLRRDLAEEAHHLSLLRRAEIDHLALGHNIRPRVDITTQREYNPEVGGTDRA